MPISIKKILNFFRAWDENKHLKGLKHLKKSAETRKISVRHGPGSPDILQTHINKKKKNMYFGNKDKSPLPADPDQAAALTLAELAFGAGDYDSAPVNANFAARMAEAGVVFNEDGFNEQGFLLRRLTARALILDTAWTQIIRDLAYEKTAKGKGTLVRAAGRLQEDLDKTFALIIKVRRAQGENVAPFLTANEQAIADDSRAEHLMHTKYGLRIPDLVRVEKLGEEIADAEFKSQIVDTPEHQPIENETSGPQPATSTCSLQVANR